MQIPQRYRDGKDQLVKSYNMCILFFKKFKFRILIFKLLLWTILVDIALLTI